MSEIPPEGKSINHRDIMIPQEEKSVNHQEIMTAHEEKGLNHQGINMPEIPSEEKSMNHQQFMQKKKKKKKPLSASTSSASDGKLEKEESYTETPSEGKSMIHQEIMQKEEEKPSSTSASSSSDGKTEKEEFFKCCYYEYEELLDRVFENLLKKNPELAGEIRKMVLRPPQVLREGTKKTVLVNFMDLCKLMHREAEHVMNFLLVEMGTTGSLDGEQRLVVKGRFAPKNFESILRKYANEYVMCSGCKSHDTILSKENRLLFLRCEQCGSGHSVAPIKAGFVACVGPRNAGT